MTVARTLMAAAGGCAMLSAALAAEPLAPQGRAWSGPAGERGAARGAIALGALAAAAAAAEDEATAREAEGGDDERRGRLHDDDDGRWARRAAVDACVDEAEAQGERFGDDPRLHHIEYVEPYKSGYRVTGVIKVRKPRYSDWDDRRAADGDEPRSDRERSFFGHSARLKFRCVAKRHRVTAFRFT